MNDGWQRSIKKRSIYEAAKRVEDDELPITSTNIANNMNTYHVNKFNMTAKQISGLIQHIPVMRKIGEIKTSKGYTPIYGFKKEWE